MGLRVVVDFDMCTNSGLCMQLCPEVFEIRSDGHLHILQAEPSEALVDRVRMATDECPTGAISIEE